MPLPFRRSRLNGSTSGQKFGTTIEKEELEKSICDDEDESQTPNLKKKPKLSLNDQYPLNEARTPIAIKGWNTCSTGFCSKSISKSAKPKLKNNISKTQRTKVVVKKVLNDSEYIVNDDGSNSMVIPESPDSIPKKNESPDSTPKKNESPDSTPKKNLDLSQTILTPNTPDSNDRKDDRGTKWIQQITWKPKTPQKTKPDFTSLIDSGKKRKPIKGGFAENLRKLQVREKSSKAIWQLEKTKSMKKVDIKLFLLRVLELENESGLIYAKCLIETCPLSFLNNQETLGLVDLVLNSKIVDEIRVQIGSLISLHHPWQRLKLSSKTVIFPSPYLEVLSNEDSDIIKKNVDNVLQEWSCPCRTTNFHPNSCPMLNGCRESMDKLTQKRNNLENESHSLTVLKTITESQKSSSSSHSETPTSSSSQVNEKHCYSVLKEVEKSGGCDNQIKLATIQGNIKNIVHSNSGRSFAPKYQLLIKDESGIYCLLDLPLLKNNRKDDVWSQILRVGIGMKVRFIGLSITERLVTQSNDDILSVILEIQESQDKTIQPFIYIFKALHGDTKIKIL